MTSSERIAEQLVQARLQARALAGFPGDIPSTLAEAYACQEAMISRWPDRLCGWKVARIPREWSNKFPEERLIGPVFQENVRYAQSGEIRECPVFAGGLAAVEAELVIKVAADAPGGELNWTLEEAESLIASIHIGVEVASSPLATLNDLGSGAVISDFGNNWGVIVGPEIPDWRDCAAVPAETRIDGITVGRGTANMRGGALGAFLFTLAKSGSRGRPLRKGDVISTGMITGVHDIRIGQTSQHIFTGYGELRCRIVQATPRSGGT